MTRRLEPTDKVALVIAVCLILGGIAGFIVRGDFVIPHLAWGDQPGGAQTKIEREYVTPARARFYSIAAILGGVALSGYVVWALRSSHAPPNI
jgi:hypothetical protein